ncbi:MAG: DUF4440 domain-containing protein [Acidobacteria bacterium]|nr:DUF4440 domain-containing protein [Acidobacteriota bacterium]
MKSLSLRFTTMGLAYLALTLGLFAQSASTELTLNTPLARELKADETHNYQLKLAAKQFAHVVAVQQGVDIEVNVYDPAGKLIVSMDSPNGAQGPEPVWLANRPAGTYRIEVKPFSTPTQPGRAGKYEIKLEALRATTAADGKVAQAESVFYEGLKSFKAARGNDAELLRQGTIKLKEALRVLGNDGEPSLLAGIKQMLFNFAPGVRLPEMNQLTKVPGTVTIYHSADNGTEAKQQAAFFESLVAFFQPRLKTKQQFSLAYLNKADWAQISGGQPFMVPFISPEPATLMMSSDQQMVKGMLGMFKSKVTPELNEALMHAGLTYESIAPLVIEAGGYINIASFFTTDMVGRLPKLWMNSLVENYLLQAWLGEKQPQLLTRWRLAMRIPGAVMTPSTRELDQMFNPGNMPTAGYATSRACDLAAQLYDTHKLALLDELIKAFPKGQKIDAAAAEARLYKLSPHIKAWVDSFGVKSASDAAVIAEQDVRATLELARQASERSDKSFYEQYVADSYLETNMDGKTLTLKEILDNWVAPPTINTKITLDELKIQVFGETAIASYRLNIRSQLPSNETFTMTLRNTDVLQRQGGRWRLLTEHYSTIPKPPVVAKVETKILDEYAGRYRNSDGLTSTITRDGDKLIELMDGTTMPNELLPENETTFRVKEQSWQRVFVRDGQGRVTHLLVRTPDGQEFKAIKIK